jgi:hypothetical protein
MFGFKEKLSIYLVEMNNEKPWVGFYLKKELYN